MCRFRRSSCIRRRRSRIIGVDRVQEPRRLTFSILRSYFRKIKYYVQNTRGYALSFSSRLTQSMEGFANLFCFSLKKILHKNNLRSALSSSFVESSLGRTAKLISINFNFKGLQYFFICHRKAMKFIFYLDQFLIGKKCEGRVHPCIKTILLGMCI